MGESLAHSRGAHLSIASHADAKAKEDAPPVLASATLESATVTQKGDDEGDGGGAAEDGEVPFEVARAALLAAWKRLARADPQEVFARPVDDTIAPGYSRIISVPMDLGTVLSRIKSGVYTAPSSSSSSAGSARCSLAALLFAFDRDVSLIASNCVLFNGAGSFYGKLGARFAKTWDREKQVLRQDLRRALSGELLSSTSPVTFFVVRSPCLASCRSAVTADGSAAVPKAESSAVSAEQGREDSAPSRPLDAVLRDAIEILGGLDASGLFAFPVRAVRPTP